MKNILSLVLLVTVGCSPGIDVRSDYDRDVSMKQYATYKWASIRELESLNNPLYYNELTDKRIREAVKTELEGRGYVQADSDADLVVHYHIIVDNQQMIRNDPYGNYSPYWRRHPAVIAYTEGTIIIDMMEMKTNNLAWRGSATSVLNGSSEINNELISKSVSAIFSKYPWQASKLMPVDKVKPIQ